MNIFSLLAFLNFILCILVTGYIFRLSHRASITITYALLLLGVALWSLGYTFIYPERDPSRLWAWYKISSLGWIYIQSLALHFSLILTESRLRKSTPFLVLLYAVPTILILRVFQGPLLISGFRSGPWGTVEILAPMEAWTAMLVLYLVSTFLLRFFFLFRFQCRNPRRHLRNQARIFLLTDGMVFAFAAAFNIIVPSMPGNSMPSLGAIATVTVPILVWYSIHEHKLFLYNMLVASKPSSPFINPSVSRHLFGLNEVFDRIGASIAVIDSKYRIVQTNENTEKLFNRKIEPGTLCYKFYYRRESPCVICPMRPDGEGRIYDLVPARDGEAWLEYYSFLIVHDDGEVDGVIKICFDATDRIRAQKRREDMERVMQHDIRNGLTGILGAVHVLRNYPLGPEESKYLALIQRNSLNLKNTINSSLDLFRMEEGTYRLAAESFDLIPILGRIGGSLRRITETRKVSLRILVDGRPEEGAGEFFMDGSPPHIENLLTNIVKNALEASPPGGIVTVSLGGGSAFLIDVHNNGAIPEQIRDRFFGKYVTWNKENGLGLGAYSARVIARAHGGDISFTTDEPCGTHILVSLPRAESSVAPRV